MLENKRCDMQLSSANENEIVECYNILRHYSKSLLEVRKMTLVEGLTVLAGSGIMFNKKEFGISLCIAVFGFLMTLFLHLLHNDYRGHWQRVCDHMCNIEGSHKLCIYNTISAGMKERRRWIKVAFHGPFILLYLAIVFILAANLSEIFQ